MPVHPTALAGEPCRLIARLDLHIGDPARGLPRAKIPSHESLHSAFAFDVRLAHTGEECLLPSILGPFSTHPLNGIESLLEDIVSARLKVALFPGPQTIARGAVRQAIVPAQGTDRSAVGLALELVDEVRSLDGAVLGLLHLLLGSSLGYLESETLLLRIGHQSSNDPLRARDDPGGR